MMAKHFTQVYGITSIVVIAKMHPVLWEQKLLCNMSYPFARMIRMCRGNGRVSTPRGK